MSSERHIHFVRLGVRNICLPEGLLRAATHIMQKTGRERRRGLVIPFFIRNNHNSLPFKGRVREGMGVKACCSIAPHPHPGLPLEGEGAKLLAFLSGNGIITAQ